MKKKNNPFFFRTLKFFYLKLFRTNDTPQRIACGLGTGVFIGILPGAGPFAALIISMLLRVNRAAAVLGALITNTWTSLITFYLAIKIGAAVMSLDWKNLYSQWQILIKDFHWKFLFRLSFLKIALPVLIGYLFIAFILGLLAYFICLIILRGGKRAIGKRVL